MNEVRALLNGARCSTSVALDARQAYDLVPMVKPQLVLIDLGLPRGEGLRLAARLRTDPATAGVGIAFLWGRPLAPDEFRLHAARAVRDCQFASEHLIRPLLQELSASGFENEELRVAG
jgi:CheY-like chemotaxis protein